MTMLRASDVRRCHNAHHPVHAAYYFAPEHDGFYAELGLERGPMAYLAGRAAPFGETGPGVVSATFYGYHPELVARHIPRAWQIASPQVVLRTRLRIVDAVLVRLLGAEGVVSDELAQAARLALRAAEACERPGRPLYSANADLPVPAAPHLAFWHAATLLREHRGDAHVGVLSSAGLVGLEALVTHSATGTHWKPSFLMRHRGWSAADWAGAQDRLRDRGLLDGAGELTPAGVELRRAVEADTDRLDLLPYSALGIEGTRRLTELAGVFSRAVLAGGGLPLSEIGKR
ncbi:hypothetical protein [Streptomyces sp. NPDC048603]|uniref:SCO6745 family protein n=1 Tax=Streptomyces sp. NPDC048603 TaxID=3365577 RepID=UPI003722A437